MAARRWGDARKALTLFRQAGETATERACDAVTRACIDANVAATEREAVIEKLVHVPLNHFRVLVATTGWADGDAGGIRQPVSTAAIIERLEDVAGPAEFHLGARAVRDIVTDLETMGLVETTIDSRDRDGRIKQIETAFDPQWVRDAIEPYAERSAEYDDFVAELG